jgi:ligand-binding sensor protein
MGGLALAGAEAGVGLIGGVFKSKQAGEQEKSRIQALNDRLKQNADVAQFNSIQRMKRLNSTLASQAALQAFSGAGSAGLVSGNMISLNDMNNFVSDENAAKLSETFQNLGIISQIQATERQGDHIQEQAIIGGVTAAATDMAQLYVPTAGFSSSSLTPNNYGVYIPPPSSTNISGEI